MKETTDSINSRALYPDETSVTFQGEGVALNYGSSQMLPVRLGRGAGGWAGMEGPHVNGFLKSRGAVICGGLPSSRLSAHGL